MIIKPNSGRLTGKPWAIIYAAGVHGIEMIDSSGTLYRRNRGEQSRMALMDIPGLVFSTVRLSSVLIATDARAWEGKLWHNAVVSLKMDGGPKIIPLRNIFEPDTTQYEILSTVAKIEKLVNAAGVNLGSLASMAWGLWRSTLNRPVTVYGPDVRDVLYGGRKECILPGEYRSGEYWDISAAYPSAQASEPYALRLKEVTPNTSISDGMGIAYAIVRIPRLPWGPIPVNVGRRAVCYGWGNAEGWWSWRDLRLARNAGADVRIMLSYVGYNETDLFGEWWKQFSPLRKLAGYPGKIAKAITSTLWGQFALSDAASHRVRWMDEWGKRRLLVEQSNSKLPHRFAVHIASETTARVRQKLWSEGLQIPDAVYCDTDSVICGKGATAPGDGWIKKKGELLQIDIRGPQVYRYSCIGCGDDHPNWHYVVGGISSKEGAERVFRREFRKHVIPLSLGHDGLTLPAMEIEKAKELINGTTD